MATVTTPSGEKLEGVTGSLLTYYRGEANIVPGYVIEDGEQAVTFPRVFDPEVSDDYVEPNADAAPAPDPAQSLADAAGAAAAENAALADATAQLGQVAAQHAAPDLPDGQYVGHDGQVYDATGTLVDPQPQG